MSETTTSYSIADRAYNLFCRLVLLLMFTVVTLLLCVNIRQTLTHPRSAVPAIVKDTWLVGCERKSRRSAMVGHRSVIEYAWEIKNIHYSRRSATDEIGICYEGGVARDMLKAYPQGQAITIYVTADEPSDAQLSPDPNVFGQALMALLSALVGLWTLRVMVVRL